MDEYKMEVGGEGWPPGTTSGPFGTFRGSLESYEQGLSRRTTGTKNGPCVVEIWAVEVGEAAY